MMQYCTICGARLETRQRHGRRRSYCPHCLAYRYRNPMAAVAGIVLNERRELLLVRRAPHQTYAGMWCIPCGHIEWGEEIRAALVREMQEETGLIVAVEQIYDVRSNFHQPEALSVGCWFLCRVASGRLRAGDDADAVGWFSYDRLPQLAFPTDRIVADELYQDGYLTDSEEEKATNE